MKPTANQTLAQDIQRILLANRVNQLVSKRQLTRTIDLEKKDNRAQRCKNCEEFKPANQSWDDHNSSKTHIRKVLKRLGQEKGLKELDWLHHKDLTIECLFFNVVYKTKLESNLHCAVHPEHQQRKQDIQTIFSQIEGLTSGASLTTVKQPDAWNVTDIATILKQAFRNRK